ncbi:MAG TPA: MarR family transcriptional regulator [Oligoflexus sp.]|uniref:MarR family winged helix-turn-helix transcriptional regulator n=1 Tax=Oligoflexus sp. TaxID=1971216 RepID=UPI002D6C3805|nr:MarR family transcriptional regulator [Oligoflexus sp.]HYX37226.1 MarR family transcriptional regulator [Oligoflexus sp.]
MAVDLKNLKDPLLDVHAHELYEALNQLLRIYQSRDRDLICCYDVSVTQCYALEAIIQKGSLRLQALAELLLLDKSTASRVIETLVRKNYVTKVQAPEDSRAVVIQATAAGKKLFQKIHTELVNEQKAMIADFKPEIRVAATALLRRLAGAAGKRMGLGSVCSTDESGGCGSC